MVPICICELSFFDYFIRIGNLSIIVYFLLYFIENKFLVWLRKEEEWTVIDRQMLDTLFDNNEKSIVEEVPELEQQADESVVEEDSEVPEEDPEETAEASSEASEEAVEEALEEELEQAVEEAETEASKILDETEIVDLLMN
jgi:hypothetical protein